MKKIISCAVFIAFLAFSTLPFNAQQNPPQILAVRADSTSPSIDGIFAKYVEAIGGKAAVEKITSRVSKGTVEVVGREEKGTVEVYEKAPHKLVKIVKIPGAGGWAWGFNGSMAWNFVPATGKVEETKGQGLTMAKFEADFYQALKLKERYSNVTLKGVQKIQYRDGPRETYVIEATPVTGGDPEKFYFDTQSGLLIRHDTVDHSEDGKVPIREFLLDYTAVDGIKVPFTTRVAQGPLIFIFRYTEVKQNVVIDDGRFNMPLVR